MNPDTSHLSGKRREITSAAGCLAGSRWKNVLTCYNHASDPHTQNCMENTGDININTCSLWNNDHSSLPVWRKRCSQPSPQPRPHPHPPLPAESRHTMHSHAAAGFLSELGVEQLQPVVHDLGGRRAAVVERPVLRSRKREREAFKSSRVNLDVQIVRIVTRRDLPEPGSPPSPPGPCHRWRRRLSPAC